MLTPLENQLKSSCGVASERPDAESIAAGLAAVLAELDALKTVATPSFPVSEIVSFDRLISSGSVSEIVKRGTKADRSIDGKTLRHIKRFEQAADIAAQRLTSVTSSTSSTPSTSQPSIPLTSTQTTEANAFLNFIRDKLKANGEQLSIKRARTRANPAWVAPRTWAKTTEQLQAVFWHRVIRDRGGFAFVLNFSPEMLARANKAPIGASQFLRKRITKALKDALGRDVDLWCSLDITKEGRLHIQGGVAVIDNELAVTEEALRKAGGLWSRHRGSKHQAWLGGCNCDFAAGALSPAREDWLQDSWATYCVRNVAALEKQTGHGCVYASQKIKLSARDQYELIRIAMNSQRLP